MIPVKLLQNEGDWFVIPNDLEEEFHSLAESLGEGSDESAEHHALCEKFERYFGHLRTGGDINNKQYYIKIK